MLSSVAWGLLWGRAKSNAVHDWQALPRNVKLGLIAALLIVAGYFLHQHEARRALKAAVAAGYQRAKDEDARVIAQMRERAAQAAANGAKISQDTRSKNDAQNSDIHSTAAAISVRGPGAAGCRRVSDPAVPVAGGKSVAAGDKLPDAAGNPVPAGDGQSDLAAVPFDWLVGRAEQADLDRAEVIAWRDWYARQSAEWERLRAPSKP